MSELACIHCEHGPHTDKQCARCSCTAWVRADIQGARALTGINNILVQGLPKLLSIGVDILEILIEVNPEAVSRIDARREEARRIETEKASQQYGAKADSSGEDTHPSGGDGQKDSKNPAGI